MSEEEEKALEAVKNAATIIKESLDAGMYMGKTCVPQLAVFVELGIVVRTVIGFTEEKKDPVIEEIGNLENKLEEIENKMKTNFDDLKDFVAEHSFYQDVPLAGTLLYEALQDALENPGEDSREKFRLQCEETQPLEYTRRLKHQLARTVTNPLHMAILAHPLQGVDIFKKWKDIYDSLYTRLFVMEAFASGLVYDKNEYRVKKIQKEYEVFTQKVDEWEKEYRSNDHYWPGPVREFVQEIQDKYEENTSDEKAEMIRSAFEGILTDDVLYITVIRESYKHSHTANLPDQNILSLNRGSCKVFLYRSRRGGKEEEAENLEKFKKNVEVHKIIRWFEAYRDVWPTDAQIKTLTSITLKESGFVLIVKANEYVGVRSTKENKFPGAHFFGKYRPRDKDWDGERNWVDYFFISGYK